MRYGDYKAVITVKNSAGVVLDEFTTFREDIITGIIGEAVIPFNDTVGEEMTIVIRPNDVRKWAGRK